jgi:hypothetical protein
MYLTSDQWWLAFFSFSLGIFAKYADLVNEHGMKQHFKGAKLLSGLLWGFSGMGMIITSPLGGLTYIAHVLYWFSQVKLEYRNHAIAGVIMVISGFYFQGSFLAEYKNDLLCVFLAYLISGYIQTYFKVNYPATKPFWRLRLRIYLIPIVYALYTHSLDPIIATGFGMIACELMTYYYREYKDDVISLTDTRNYVSQA